MTRRAQGAARAAAANAGEPGALRRQLPPLERFLRPGLPKYVALRDAIVHGVASGAWPPGTRLPNESELADALPLSLGTIQRALRLLVDDGVIVRRPGAGSFIARQSDGELHAPLHCRFVDDAGTGYLPVFPKVIGRVNATERGPWNEHLGIDAPLCIERVLRIGDEFSVFSRFYVDPGRLPAFATLPPAKLSGENFKELILRESGLPIGRIAQYVTSVDLPADVAAALSRKRASPALRLDIEAFAGRDSPLYYQMLWIPPNRRRLELPGDGRDPGLTGRAPTSR